MSPAAGVFINLIPAGAVSSSQGTNPQNANATLTVAALQPVAGAKAFLPTNLHGGGTASTVTLTLTNPNGVALTGAALTDTLPAGLAIAGDAERLDHLRRRQRCDRREHRDAVERNDPRQRQLHDQVQRRRGRIRTSTSTAT